MEGNFNFKNIKPTLSTPTKQGKALDTNFKKQVRQSGMSIKEEEKDKGQDKEKSLKKRIFKLDKMETLVHTDELLSKKFDELKGTDPDLKWGYHWNEVILNLLFNDYILNSPKYLQKYKTTRAKEKTRRGEEGIAQLQNDINKEKEASSGAEERKNDLMAAADKEELNELFGFASKTTPTPTAPTSQNDQYFIDSSNRIVAVAPYLDQNSYKQIIQQYAGKPNIKQVPWYAALHGSPMTNNQPVKGVPAQVSDQTSQDAQQAQQATQQYSSVPAMVREEEVVETTGSGNSGAFSMGLDAVNKEIADRTYQNETTTSASSGQYSGPGIWAKNPSNARFAHKPAWKGGKVLGESVINGDLNYLTDPTAFKKYILQSEILQFLNEDFVPEGNETFKQHAQKTLGKLHQMAIEDPNIENTPGYQDAFEIATYELETGKAHPSRGGDPIQTQVAQQQTATQPVQQATQPAQQPAVQYPTWQQQPAVKQPAVQKSEPTAQWKQPVAPMAEEEISEHHLHTREDKIAFILQHTYDDATDSAQYSQEQLNSMSDEDIEKLYLDTEHKIGMNETPQADDKSEMYREIESMLRPTDHALAFNELQDIANQYGVDFEDATDTMMKVIADRENRKQEDAGYVVADALKELNHNAQNFVSLEQVMNYLHQNYDMSEYDPDQVEIAYEKLTRDPHQLALFEANNFKQTMVKDLKYTGRKASDKESDGELESKDGLFKGKWNDNKKVSNEPIAEGFGGDPEVGEDQYKEENDVNEYIALEKQLQELTALKAAGNIEALKAKLATLPIIPMASHAGNHQELGHRDLEDLGYLKIGYDYVDQDDHELRITNISNKPIAQLMGQFRHEYRIIEPGQSDLDEATLIKKHLITEKAVSKKQQKFFGMVHAAQKGKLKHPSKAVAKVASEISDKDADDFASTKHKGLPEKKKEKKKEKVDEGIFGNDRPELNVDQIAQTLNNFKQSPDSQQLRDQFVKVKDFVKAKAGNIARMPQLKMWLDQNMPQLSNYVGLLWGNWDLMPTNAVSETTDKMKIDEKEYKEFVKNKLKSKGKPFNSMNEDEKKQFFTESHSEFKQLKESMIDDQPDSMINNQQDSMVNSMASDETNTDGSAPSSSSSSSTDEVPPVEENDVPMNAIEPDLDPENDPELDQIAKHQFNPSYNAKLRVPATTVSHREKALADQSAKLKAMFGVDSIDQLNGVQRQQYIKSLNIPQPKPITGLGGNIDETKLKETKKEMEKEKVNEERKNSAILNVEKLGAENAKNFKADMPKEDALSQDKTYPHDDGLHKAPVFPDPSKFYIAQGKGNSQEFAQQITKEAKTMADLEREQLAKSKGALANVGNATADGKSIPKRNLTKEEKYELAMNRGDGMQDIVYDNKPSEKFEKRMEQDMGDNIYKIRQDKMDYKAGAPMYNKDTQPTEKGQEKEEDNKFARGYNNESVVTGKFSDEYGKIKLVEFKMTDVQELTSIDENAFKLAVDGMGNKYSLVGKKINENADFEKIAAKYDFYINENKVFAIEKKADVAPAEKKTINESKFDKMKHLMNYKASNYVDSSKSVKF